MECLFFFDNGGEVNFSVDYRSYFGLYTKFRERFDGNFIFIKEVEEE